MKSFKIFLNESSNSKLESALEAFVPFVKEELGVKTLPEVKIISRDECKDKPTFGWWDGESVTVCPDGRHVMDVLRTIAHEFIHATHGHTDGSDGSDHENEANAKAGIIMRKFGRDHKNLF